MPPARRVTQRRIYAPPPTAHRRIARGARRPQRRPPAAGRNDDAAPRATFAQVEERIRKATTIDALDEAATLIQTFGVREQKGMSATTATNQTAVRWKYVADAGVPSDERTVCIAVADGDESSTGLGWWDSLAGCWRDAANGDSLADGVYAWAEELAPPPRRPVLVKAA